MRNKLVYAILAVLLVLLVLSIFEDVGKPKFVDWSHNLYNKKTEPYGTYITYELLPDIFPDAKVASTRQSISTNLNEYVTDYIDFYDDDELSEEQLKNKDSLFVTANPLLYENIETTEDISSYIFINKNFFIGDWDLTYLLGYVGLGNNVFISAEYFSEEFMNKLGLVLDSSAKVDSIYTLSDYPDKSYIYSKGLRRSKSSLKDSLINTDEYRILATDKHNQTIFAQVKYGKGYFYIHTMPITFTNIEMLETDKYDFAFRCLSYLPKDADVTWDEYYKQGPIDADGEDSIFRVIFNSKPLTFAFWIITVGMLLFILFRIKRTQRVIPIVKPLVNSSLEYLDTIGNLYFRKKEYRGNILKRQAYLLDFIRTNYYMPTEQVDAEFISNLSGKSGVTDIVLRDLFDIYKNARDESEEVTQFMFLKYNGLLEEFYRVAKNK